jgi:hypothetical protein
MGSQQQSSNSGVLVVPLLQLKDSIVNPQTLISALVTGKIQSIKEENIVT